MKEIPYSTIVDKKGEIKIIQNYDIHFVNSNVKRKLAYLKGGIRIAGSVVKKEKPFIGNEEEIIKQIHNQRFNPQEGHIITGGHFHQQYVRNLGIFYNAVLDPRMQSSEEDWVNRQRISLQSVMLSLEIFRQSKQLFTRIDHTKEHNYTGVNIYTYPSDSLFGILYMLNALRDPTFIAQNFPSVNPIKNNVKIQTIKTTNKIIETYKNDLIYLVKEYEKYSANPKSKLIKKDIYLASARDGIKRTSSFYDNVILWATLRLADKLSIIKTEKRILEKWQKGIIQTFWDKTEGVFLDDLSEESKKEKTFSADAFIVISTGFLNIENDADRDILLRMVQYVKKNNLDKPFPLHYSKKNNHKKLYLPVRYFAPSYMGETIWSHWGMEYIKTLILLSKYYPDLLKDAEQHLSAYKQNIEQSGGYPELYNKKGKLPKGKYKSILHTSWVVNYEQAKMLFKAASTRQV